MMNNHATLLESLAQFEARNFADKKFPAAIAVAVSGGVDSMALLHALHLYSKAHDVELYAYTVDHGLRPEAKGEAEQVAAFCQSIGVVHKVLLWEHSDKPQARIQEEARGARYALMAEQMEHDAVSYLFLAHHMGDQAETFLFRLAKGSGLDGLGAMRSLATHASGITLCRPFLDVDKATLYAYCSEFSIPYVEDPSNHNEDFARVRLRNSMSILEEEGLSAKRLSVMARRMARARDALDNIALRAFDNTLNDINSDRVVFNFKALKENEEEVSLRVLLLGLAHFQEGGYGVRREKVEALFEELLFAPEFRRRTLGGVIFTRDDKNNQVILEKE